MVRWQRTRRDILLLRPDHLLPVNRHNHSLLLAYLTTAIQAMRIAMVNNHKNNEKNKKKNDTLHQLVGAVA
jgi:hypothetical protein